MRAAEIQKLYEYNAWANDRVLQAANWLTPEQFTAPAAVSFGSLRGTLVHLLSAEWIWRVHACAGISPDAMLNEASFPVLAEVQARFAHEARQMHDFVTGLDDGALDRPVRYTNTKGTPLETPLWQVLLHVVNHSTQFRSEAGVVLTSFGASPGDLDLIGFLRERGTHEAG